MCRVVALPLALVLAAQPSLRPWPEAEGKASAVLGRMSRLEMQQLMNGVHDESELGWYVGNTPGIARLAVPALKMQDASQGFRPTTDTEIGTTTCWPSLLAMAATWDDKLLWSYAAAIGREFRGKGANVILGPSVNVHRTAYMGRNFEYLSGEDPYLGARLTAAYIRGVHSEGVMAVAKHFAFNEQETEQDNSSSDVDLRTAWMLYYPPFQAAVDAGAVAFMCSYNLVNGTHACENTRLLQDLREGMGFRGFVQSDWGAAHSTSVVAGLDQDMPGSDGYFDSSNLDRLASSAVEQSAHRILTGIYRLQLDVRPGCSPPCYAERASNQTSEEHRQLAAEFASSSVVLLKNDGVLPLRNLSRIAVVGHAAASMPSKGRQHQADYYSGGGSGHVTPSRVVTPLHGILRGAAAAGVAVEVSASDDLKNATAAAKTADLVIVIAATTSGEAWEGGGDRRSLTLDGNADALIWNMTESRQTVVLMQMPGAVLTPWRDAVSAIAGMFLGGEETGSAWANVLFGATEPAGRLPIMLPESEADTIRPGKGPHVAYAEGLFTSYRSRNMKAAFPFGHGLTYTTFEYGALELSSCIAAACVKLTVQNVGSRQGQEVVQAYVEFQVSDFPALMLRGFHKTRLLSPGEAEVVEFALTTRDLSVFDADAGWVLQKSARLHVGASSSDIRRVTTLLTDAVYI
eukprot:TRINITY_DN41523_c0_g1_i1.p1 TRINITY_DN41523_c0_g1~~TRINITY_DN41523_c0_g1_i1.p1  ORF type:complete len:694 (-),score=118.80 TRINITY_DN41523_c0_g1_i1:122-2182(-)